MKSIRCHIEKIQGKLYACLGDNHDFVVVGEIHPKSLEIQVGDTVFYHEIKTILKYEDRDGSIAICKDCQGIPYRFPVKVLSRFIVGTQIEGYKHEDYFVVQKIGTDKPTILEWIKDQVNNLFSLRRALAILL